MMMYPFMMLSDGTEIVHSDMDKNGNVRVYIEQPDEKYCFKHATCWLPKYQWEDIYQFNDAEIATYEDIIRSTAHTLLF